MKDINEKLRENTKMSDEKSSGSMKDQVISHFGCSECKRRLEEGEFMAVIGSTPPSGLSMPVGRADAIIRLVGKIYCEECFDALCRDPSGAGLVDQ